MQNQGLDVRSGFSTLNRTTNGCELLTQCEPKKFRNQRDLRYFFKRR